MRKRCLSLIILGALAAGCQATASRPENSANPRIDGYRIEPFYDEQKTSGLELNRIVSDMAEDLVRTRVKTTEKPDQLIIATFVNLDDMRGTTRLSRAIQEDFIHEMHRRGEPVADFHMTGNVSVTPQGDMVYSRDFAKLASKFPASRVLAGTIQRNSKGYVVNARIESFRTRSVEATAIGFIPYKYAPYEAYVEHSASGSSGKAGSTTSSARSGSSYSGKGSAKGSGARTAAQGQNVTPGKGPVCQSGCLPPKQVAADGNGLVIRENNSVEEFRKQKKWWRFGDD